MVCKRFTITMQPLRNRFEITLRPLCSHLQSLCARSPITLQSLSDPFATELELLYYYCTLALISLEMALQSFATALQSQCDHFESPRNHFCNRSGIALRSLYDRNAIALQSHNARSAIFGNRFVISYATDLESLYNHFIIAVHRFATSSQSFCARSAITSQSRSGIALQSLYNRFVITLLIFCNRFALVEQFLGHSLRNPFAAELESFLNHFASPLQSIYDRFAIALQSLCDRSAIISQSLSNRFATERNRFPIALQQI
jgi:hypothetical protein